jgi:ATP-dependent helicase YprA (DUF1998 family)
LDDRAALVECRDPGYVTRARETTEIDMVKELRRASWGEADVAFGEVRVTRRVTGYSMIRSGVKAGEAGLALPPRVLSTRAIWWTIPNGSCRFPIDVDIAGSVHAVEHASIGMLPLFATCDRRDMGGLSAVRHPATGRLSVFVYDEHEGGAGFAERAFGVAAQWLRATRDAIAACPCEAGCPACVQSPGCGSGNSPLSKRGAVDLLGALLAGAPRLADQARSGKDLQEIVRPPPGGRAGAALRSGPGGVGRLRYTGKLIRIRSVLSPPDRKNPCNEITTYDLRHEQAFPWIICAKRIFLARWRAGPRAVTARRASRGYTERDDM